MMQGPCSRVRTRLANAGAALPNKFGNLPRPRRPLTSREREVATVRDRLVLHARPVARRLYICPLQPDTGNAHRARRPCCYTALASNAKRRGPAPFAYALGGANGEPDRLLVLERFAELRRQRC